jgi:transposase
MIEMLKRHEIQVLRRAGHTWPQVAALTGVSVGTARRVAAEDAVTTVDNAAARAQRQIGRPSKAEAYRDVLVKALTEDPALRSVELLHRARVAGYVGGKSAVYALAQTLRVRSVAPLVRFDGVGFKNPVKLPGRIRERPHRDNRDVRYKSRSRVGPTLAANLLDAAA